MDYDYEVKQFAFDQICRLCVSTSMDFDLSSNPLPPVLTTKNLKFQKLCYSEMAEIVFQVKLAEDGPKGVCEGCARKLVDFYEFKIQFEISQAELRNLIGFSEFNSDLIPQRNNFEILLEDKPLVIYGAENENCSVKIEPDCFENNEIIESKNDLNFSVNEELFDINENIEIMPFDANNCDNNLTNLDNNDSMMESSNSKNFQLIEKAELLPIDEYFEEKNKLSFTKFNKKKYKELDKNFIVKFECKLCNKEFSSRSAELAHQTVHSEKQFECDVCHKKFTTVYHLKSHFSTIHLRINKRYTCEICGRCFSKISDLNRHMRVHSDKTIFQCSMCTKEFKWKSSYEVHLASHTGIKKYKCAKCDNAYTSGCSLKKHQVKHKHL